MGKKYSSHSAFCGTTEKLHDCVCMCECVREFVHARVMWVSLWEGKDKGWTSEKNHGMKVLLFLLTSAMSWAELCYSILHHDALRIQRCAPAIRFDSMARTFKGVRFGCNPVWHRIELEYFYFLCSLIACIVLKKRYHHQPPYSEADFKIRISNAVLNCLYDRFVVEVLAIIFVKELWMSIYN